MNSVMRPRLGYMKGEEFVDQFNKENSAPWNQYSTKSLREKQGKQMTPTCLTCCLNSVPPPPSLPPLISFSHLQTRRQSARVLWTYRTKLTPACLSGDGMEIWGPGGWGAVTNIWRKLTIYTTKDNVKNFYTSNQL
jgi:hypothetical protein